jgi:hypothetical protein
VGLGFTPLGTLLDVATVLTGKDIITGERVSSLAAVVGLVPGVSEARKVFTATGQISKIGRAQARLIMPASKLRNPAIPGGFAKYSTRFQANGRTYETHFYMNPKTGKVYYDLDYKTLPSGR